MLPLALRVLDPLRLVLLVPANLHAISKGHVAVGIVLILTGSSLAYCVRACIGLASTAAVGPGGLVLIVTESRVMGHVADRVIVKVLLRISCHINQAIKVVVGKRQVHLVGSRGGGFDEPIRLVLITSLIKLALGLRWGLTVAALLMGGVIGGFYTGLREPLPAGGVMEVFLQAVGELCVRKVSGRIVT